MKILKKAMCSSLAVLVLSGCPMVVNDFNFTNTPVAITASATQTRSYNFSKNYKLTGNYANDIVSVAKAQLNKSGSNLGYSEQWCADFATDCARLTGMKTSIIPYTDSSRGSCIQLYKKLINNCNAKVVSTPRVGDLVFFDWNGKKSVNNLHHIAIITAVSGNKVTYIGGNQGSGNLYTRKVTQVTINNYKTYSSFAKFVRPNYGNTKITNNNNNNNVSTTNTSSGNFPKYTGKSNSVVDALKSLKIDSSSANRKKIAAANGISNYSGTAAQNTKMLNLLKQGKLKKVANSTPVVNKSYFKKYTGSTSSIVTALNSIGATSTYAYRKKIAAANGISNYSGTAAQNTKMLNLLKQGKLIKP